MLESRCCLTVAGDLPGTLLVEDFVHGGPCSGGLSSLGTAFSEDSSQRTDCVSVYGEHVESLPESMPNAPLLQYASISSVLRNVTKLDHKGEAVLRGNL